MADTFVERLVVGVGFKTDTGSLKGVMSEFRGAFTALTGFATALTGAAVAGATFALTQAANIDETAKLAGALRTNTEELTAMQFAMGRSGLDAKVFEQTMIRLDTSISDAATNTGGPAAEAFRALGLSTHFADGTLRDAVGSVSDIAGAMSEMSDEGVKGTAIYDLFGRQSARLRPLLESGAEGIEALTTRAEELGLVLGSKAAAEGEALMDSMEGLQGVVRGLGWQISGVLIPPMTRAVDGLTDWLSAGDGIIRLGLDRVTNGLAWAMRALETPAGRVATIFTGLGAVLGATKAASFGAGALRAVPLVGQLASGMASVAPQAALLAAGVAIAGLAIEDLVVTAEGGDSVLRRFADSLGVGEETAGILAGVGDLATSSWDAFLVIMTEVGKEFAVLLPTWEDIGTSMEDLAEAVGLPRDAFEGLLSTVKELIGTGLPEWLSDISSAISGSAQGFKSLAAFARGDPSVIFTGDPIDPDSPGFVGDLVRTAGSARERVTGSTGLDESTTPAQQSALAQSFIVAPGIAVNPSVTVQSGASSADVAAAAGDAVERETRRQLDAVDGLQ